MRTAGFCMRNRAVRGRAEGMREQRGENAGASRENTGASREDAGTSGEDTGASDPGNVSVVVGRERE